MPQLDRKYPSGAAKRGGEPTEESAASSTQVVSSSYVCLVHNQMYHVHKNSTFVKMKLINTCFRTFKFLSKDFFFMYLS